MKIERKVNPKFTKWMQTKDSNPLIKILKPCKMYMYVLESDKGIVEMEYLKVAPEYKDDRSKAWKWVLKCTKGSIFSGVKEFETLEDAKKWTKNLM